MGDFFGLLLDIIVFEGTLDPTDILIRCESRQECLNRHHWQDLLDALDGAEGRGHDALLPVIADLLRVHLVVDIHVMC